MDVIESHPKYYLASSTIFEDVIKKKPPSYLTEF